MILASGSTGTRHVVATSIVGRGVFKGVGRIVEVQNLPGDPDNIARDDLVFASGTLHLVSTTLGAEFSIDPATESPDNSMYQSLPDRQTLGQSSGAF